MTVNAALRLMAGSVILISLALGTYLNSNWYYLTGFVGLNLLQSGFTKWCPAVAIFRMMKLTEQSCSSGMSVHQGVHIIAGGIVLATTALVVLLAAPQQVFIHYGYCWCQPDAIRVHRLVPRLHNGPPAGL